MYVATVVLGAAVPTGPHLQMAVSWSTATPWRKVGSLLSKALRFDTTISRRLLWVGPGDAVGGCHKQDCGHSLSGKSREGGGSHLTIRDCGRRGGSSLANGLGGGGRGERDGGKLVHTTRGGVKVRLGGGHRLGASGDLRRDQRAAECLAARGLQPSEHVRTKAAAFDLHGRDRARGDGPRGDR